MLRPAGALALWFHVRAFTAIVSVQKVPRLRDSADVGRNLAVRTACAMVRTNE